MSGPSLSLSAEDCRAGLSRLIDRQTDDSGRLRIDPDTAEQDLAKLVLGLVEFLRQVMELQAIRKLDQGTLTPAQEEELGLTLMRSAQAIRDIAGRFGLSEEDLSLDLGPLGRLT